MLRPGTEFAAFGVAVRFGIGLPFGPLSRMRLIVLTRSTKRCFSAAS
jgi:hypothetical protein